MSKTEHDAATEMVVALIAAGKVSSPDTVAAAYKTIIKAVYNGNRDALDEVSNRK